MARLNIYIPDELHDAISLHRDRMNLSEICASAIRSELMSIQTGVKRERLPGGAEWSRSGAESEIARRHELRMVRVAPGETATDKENVARVAAELVDSLVRDGMQIAVGGGAQINVMLNYLKPRNVRVQISAIGYEHVDREVPAIHPNLLATRLSLLYARSAVALVGDTRLTERWPLIPEAAAGDVTRLIIGSAGHWDRHSAHARLLGSEITEVLNEKGAVGDFLGVFLDRDAQPIEPYVASAPVSNLGSATLYAYARRHDTLVLMLGGNFMKVVTVEKALKAKLCNAVILDEHTGSVIASRLRSGTE